MTSREQAELEGYRAKRLLVIEMAKKGAVELRKCWQGGYNYGMDEEELVSPDMPPFWHKDIEHLQINIGLAKKLRDDGNALAGVLICINIVDYLAEFIANGLTAINMEAMDKYYLGTILYAPKKPKEFTIRNSMDVISNYDFAGKEKLMHLLGKINHDRNHVAHKIVKSGKKAVPEADKKINELFVLTDKLINISNTMQTGFPPINVIDKYQKAK